MAIKYQFEIDQEILFVTASGYDENLKEVTEYGKAVIEESIKQKCKYILADERQLEYRIGTVDIIDLVEFYSEYSPNVRKAALLFNPANIEDAKFWETVAINRGLTVRVFKEKKEALSWFKK